MQNFIYGNNRENNMLSVGQAIQWKLFIECYHKVIKVKTGPHRKLYVHNLNILF